MTFLSIILILFLLNITLYSVSENYRFFIQKMKNPEEIVYPDEAKIIDSIAVSQPDLEVDYTPSQEEIDILATATTVSSKDTPKKINTDSQEVIQNKVVLGDKYNEVLELFSRYNLWKLELHSNLFDITDEYPDEYYEYYSRDIILYLFPTKTYSEVFDIFDVQKNLPIELNVVNNFGDNSFYINTLPKDEKHVRLVINHKSIVFWLKIKKDEYNTIKQILNTL